MNQLDLQNPFFINNTMDNRKLTQVDNMNQFLHIPHQKSKTIDFSPSYLKLESHRTKKWNNNNNNNNNDEDTAFPSSSSDQLKVDFSFRDDMQIFNNSKCYENNGP